jgi:hypothetical protein
MGTASEPVPVTAFAVNFSPIPRIAPPPFGSEICGTVKADDSSFCPFGPADVMTDFSAIACPRKGQLLIAK